MLGTQGSARALWLLAPALLLYAGTFVVPLVIILVYSVATFEGGIVRFGLDLGNYEAAFSDGVTLTVLWRTVRLSLLVTLISAVVGFPVALQLRRSGPAMRTLILALIVAPLLTSVIVRNVAWLLVLGRTGLVNNALAGLGLTEAPLPLMYNDAGVVAATVHVYLTFLVLPVYGALLGIDERVEESAASLGAGPASVFWRITFPLAVPGLVAGCSLVFVLAMGLYLTPAIMGGGFVVTIPMMITDLVRNQYNWPMASALAVLLLAAIGALLVLALPFQRRRGEA